jgi:hypothetical protein
MDVSSTPSTIEELIGPGAGVQGNVHEHGMAEEARVISVIFGRFQRRDNDNDNDLSKTATCALWRHDERRLR